MNEHVYLLTIILPLAAILIVFTMKYGSAALQARTTKASEQSYRALAERSAAAQQENAAALAAIRTDVAAIGASLASVEMILKQVG